jgi:hypothetical protein
MLGPGVPPIFVMAPDPSAHHHHHTPSQVVRARPPCTRLDGAAP